MPDNDNDNSFKDNMEAVATLVNKLEVANIRGDRLQGIVDAQDLYIQKLESLTEALRTTVTTERIKGSQL